MAQKKLKVSVKGKTEVCNWKAILPFQGDLKLMTDETRSQLKKQMTSHGFNSPFHIWQDKTGKCYLLDGHQRLDILGQLEKEGWEIPAELPMNLIEAKSKSEAKRILLSRVAQYGKVSNGGLYEFMVDGGINIDEIKDGFSIPDINIEKFETQYFTPVEQKEITGSKEIGEESFSNMVHKCPKCGHKFGKGA